MARAGWFAASIMPATSWQARRSADTLPMRFWRTEPSGSASTKHVPKSESRWGSPERRNLGCRRRGLARRLDLTDRVDHGIEGQHGRGMACLIVAHRHQNGEIAPLARGRLGILLQDRTRLLANRAKFAGRGPDDLARHDRGGRLPKRAGFDVMPEAGDDIAVHRQIDGDGGAAQPGMRGRSRVRRRQSLEQRDVSCQFQDAFVVDVAQHDLVLAGSGMTGARFQYRVERLRAGDGWRPMMPQEQNLSQFLRGDAMSRRP